MLRLRGGVTWWCSEWSDCLENINEWKKKNYTLYMGLGMLWVLRSKLKPPINVRRQLSNNKSKARTPSWARCLADACCFAHQTACHITWRAPSYIEYEVSNRTSARACFVTIIIISCFFLFDIYLFTCEIFRRKLGSYAKLSYRFSVTGSVEMLTFRECGGCAVIICSWSVLDDIVQFYCWSPLSQRFARDCLINLQIIFVFVWRQINFYYFRFLERWKW